MKRKPKLLDQLELWIIKLYFLVKLAAFMFQDLFGP